MYTLGDLAQRLGLAFSGDAQRPLTGLASLAAAGPGQLAFLADRKYLAQLGATRAGAVIVHPDFAAQCPADCLLSDAPYLSFARASQLFDRSPPPVPGIHRAAVVAADARVHPQASVGPHAVVEPGAVLERGAVLGAGAYLGHGSRLGAGTRVFPQAVIYHDVQVGEHCVIHSQAVLGADGFGFAPGPEGWEKICQLGGVRIGNHVEIGASRSRCWSDASLIAAAAVNCLLSEPMRKTPLRRSLVRFSMSASPNPREY